MPALRPVVSMPAFRPVVSFASAFPAIASPLRETFALYQSDDAESAWIRAQHLAAVVRQTPFLMGANVFCAGVVVATVAQWSPQLLACWIAALGAVIGLALRAYAHTRGRPAVAASRRAFRRSTLHAAVLGSLWGLVPLLWFAPLPPSAQLVVAALTAGMLSAGAFALGPLPEASLAYVATLVAGASGALWRFGGPANAMLGVLLCAIAFTCATGAFAIGRRSVKLLRSEREAERQRRMLSVLLDDFEEHAAEALWETTTEGRLVRASSRLGELLRTGVAEVIGKSLQDVLESQSPGAGATVLATFAKEQPFRALALQVVRDGGERWWQLSAKPVTDDRRQVLGWRGVLVDATAEITAERQLRRLAHFDDLTGLANRVTLHVAIREHLRTGGVGALLSLDLDHFKAINDTFGHSTGDDVLVAAAARLQGLVRPGDLVARLGGDEFAVLIRSVADCTQVDALAHRLLVAFSHPCDVRGRRHFVGLSVGIALFPEHGTDVDELLGNAALAQYEAKAAGRGRATVYSASLGDRSRRRAAVEQALAHAADRGELSLQWQPQVDVSTWQLVGAEALIRWNHPALGTVGPDEFIAIAEQAGLVTRVGTWALREACRAAAEQPDGLAIAVNISPVQLRDGDFVTMVRDTLEDSGLDPHRLEIELTESIFLGDSESVLGRLRALQALGVRIALDDFGTGVSVAGLLAAFPVRHAED